MEALIKLVSTQRIEIQKMEKHMIPQIARELVDNQNQRFDKKLN
jgi:hypothetical protein